MAQPTYNEIHQHDSRRQAAEQAYSYQPPRADKYDGDDDDSDDEDDGGGNSNFNRNLLIGVIAAALLIGLLSAMRHCNSQEDRRMEATADSVALVAADSQDPLAIFNAELSRNNMTNDGAIGAAAVKFGGTDPENPDRIVGVTYKNDDDRPFIKIYQLTRSGSLWQPQLVQTKYLDGRTINMANSALMAREGTVPRAVRIDGKDYLYFAFVNNLRNAGEGNNGRVALCLYDLDTKKITTLNFDGPIKTRTDGRQYIYGKPLESTSGTERKFLRQEADNIRVIYFQSEEELKAEEEARLKAEEEKALAGEENADAKWSHDNAEKMDKLNEGEEVRMDAPQYNKPIFNIKDIASKLENDKYLVFADKKGAVYGFNKDSRKYFVIYTPGASGTATGISFGGDGNLHIKTSGGNTISYDLAHDRAKTVDNK